jgi:ATP-dependent helicase HepA
LANKFSNLLTNINRPAVDSFVLETQVLTKEIELEMHKGRDQLLELNSCRQEQSQYLIDQLYKIDKDQLLWPYMESIFDCYGVDVEYHSKDCHILKLSESLRVSFFPYVSEEGVTVTVSRDIALAREDMQFITQEHPMVLSAMDLVLSSETGNAAISVIKHAALAAGQFLLELLFIVECSAPAELKIGRFLPPTPIRILIDQNKQNLSESISHQSMLETNDNIDKDQVVNFLNSQRVLIHELIYSAEVAATKQMRQLIEESSERMLEILTAEIQRLIRLKKINPTIKPEEIEQLKNRMVLSRKNIKHAQIRLDAVRFVVAS